MATYLMDNCVMKSAMIFRTLYIFLIAAFVLSECRNAEKENDLGDQSIHSSATNSSSNDIIVTNASPLKLVRYAKTLIGTPYLYASADPDAGFDCSGFIKYVFNHFHVIVPRSSVDFTNEGRRILLKKARPGDLILFTGRNSKKKRVGHMGIIVSNLEGRIRFIHSSSGSGVMISSMKNYYQTRFIKVIRVFPDRKIDTVH